MVQYLGHHFDGEEEKCLFIFLEFVAGGSLANMIAGFGALSEDVTRCYTKQIVEGLIYVHNEG